MDPVLHALREVFKATLLYVRIYHTNTPTTNNNNQSTERDKRAMYGTLSLSLSISKEARRRFTRFNSTEKIEKKSLVFVSGGGAVSGVLH
jgi:hypothetical protein